MADLTARPDLVEQFADDDASEFLRLACLVYGGDDLERQRQAAELLRRDPSLARRSIHTAAAAGDAEAAREHLRDATIAGGPFGWEPLLYAAYSRVPGDHVAVARLLLEAGADPNAGYLWDGTYRFTALTGAFGNGEDSPNQPPHPQALELARVLLEAGADPNDDQTIYNRHFTPGTDYLALLLEFGLDRRALLEDALVFVADNDRYADRVALLLQHGVDPEGRGTRHPALRDQRPIERAIANGAVANEALLRQAGAQPPAMDEIDDLLARCMRGEHADGAHAAALIRRHPRALIDAVERGNRRGVEALAQAGYDVNRLAGFGALHIAAYVGDRPMCELLLRLGADPSLRDGTHDGTPADWARHSHHDELAAWLQAR